MKKISVLQFINVRWFNAEANYGITLSKKLFQKGHNVFVCGIDGTPPVEQAKNLGLPVFTSLKLHHYSPYYLGKDLSLLKDFIRKEKIQIINAHRSEGHLLGALYKKFYDNKIILIRTRGDMRLPKNYFFNRLLYNYTDKIITSAQIMQKTYFNKLNVPPDKITTIYNPVDTVKFNPKTEGTEIRKKLGIKDNDILVGIVGRLSPVKGHKYFVDAASFILKEKPDVKFLIAGKESQVKYQDLKNQIKSLGIEKSFIFSGVESDVAKLIASIDIGVVASLGSETNCRVTLEFMAMAKSVVATSVGVIPEVLINNECGIIVPPADANALSEGILKMIKNPDISQQMAQKSRIRVEENFNEGLFVENTEKVYYSLL
ncbi:glycosyltransferase family 4 protein [Candidatus Desantisbacteria bacterium]|nr:glycosyltransferase family 4 protein [Candidatus Desantisbacteria bacterium]